MKHLRQIVARAALVLAVALAVAPASASGMKKIGRWVVITDDKDDGRKDVAAVLSEPGEPFGLALRCIAAQASIALLPAKDERLFGRAGRSAASFTQADGGTALERSGQVGRDGAVHVQDPMPLLRLILSAPMLEIQVPAPDRPPVSARFGLADVATALADLARQCPSS